MSTISQPTLVKYILIADHVSGPPEMLGRMIYLLHQSNSAHKFLHAG